MQYKTILIATLRAFADFCDREGLRWYMAFGSAIGTVREGGLIPWDDDIDVYMPREDMRRLLSLSAPDGYEILHLTTSSQPLPYAYAKFCDRSSTIWEQRKYPCIIGIFIDIFPLDQVPSADAAALRKAYLRSLVAYKRSIRRTGFGQWWRSSLRNKLAAVQDFIYYRPMRSRFRSRLLEADSAAARRSGDKYILYDNIYGDAKVLYDKALFDGEPVWGEFEGLRVPLPCGNDALLKQIYGDYMTPPPEEKRVSGHHHYFMDLSCRLSLTDINPI